LAVDDPRQLWCRVLDFLRNQVPADAYTTWLAPTEGVSLQNDTLVVSVPNQFFIDWLGQYYVGAIEEACRTALSGGCRIAFRANGATAPASAAPVRRRITLSAEQTKLQERYTFAQYIVADCNQFAVAAARAVAESPGSKYNPLLIHGGVGLGKTHLLQAIGNFTAGTRSGFRVYYTPAEALFTELIMAIERGSTMEFKQKYRGQDMLLIDDVHYLVGKERLQEEVFHIFNHLHGARRQIVFTSDRPVREIPTLEERLSSRLTSGLVADLQPPDLETRVAILQRKAESEHMELPPDVALFIATRVKTNVRQLEGCLIRIAALASMNGDRISLELATKALRDLVPSPQISREAILEQVGSVYGVTPSEIRSKVRTQRITLARQLTMYLYRSLLELSLKEIGGLLGGRDHTTVIHSVAKIEDLRRNDPEFDEQVRRLVLSMGH
jgi:chromosomal replication initiator protein